MPKGLNLKGFVRRKSSGNILDFPSPDEQSSGAAPSSTFRVIERPEKKGVTYGAAPDRSVTRPFNSPLHTLRGKSENDLSKGSARQRAAGWPLTGAVRGSGGTTNSGSSGYYDSSSASARHSSTSTLPSSVDPHPEEEELFPVRTSATTGMYQTVSAGADDHAPLPPPPSFSTRAARAFSFGRKTGRPSTDTNDAPPMPPAHQSNGGSTRPATGAASPHRDRAMTTSSYASTAVPIKPELNLGNDFGDDFSSSMFDSLQKKEPPPPLPIAGSFHRTESEPMFPPRTLSRNAVSKSPSPNPLQFNRDDNASPYSYDEPNSAGFSSSSALSSPDPSDPAANGITQAFLGNSKTGYSRVPDRYASPVLESESTDSYSSAGFMAKNGKAREHEYPSRQTHVDDDYQGLKRVELHDPQASSSSASRLAPASSRANGTNGSSTFRAGPASPGSSAGESWAGADSITTTPRAAGRAGVTRNEDSMFDASPSGPASRAIRPATRDQRADGTPKKMTKEQFRDLQKRGESSAQQSDEEEDASGDEYDDEDDIERAKKLAAQRATQNANMAVYRQQMKKVTGGGPADLPSSGASVRPSNDRSASSASGGFYLGGISGTPPADTVRGKHTGDDDEDVPLGILQAHGFPSANRPPTVGENDMHQRRASMAGSAIGGGGGRLPAFARNLPQDPYMQDPYYGAGLVNQSTRESLAMNSGASVYGMPTGPQPPMHMSQQPMGHPGGLVGVIAGEEKARAARRGSPNTAAGSFSTMGNMGMQQPPPQMGRAMSMGNLAPPSVYTPSGLPPMPMMPQMGMPQMGMPQMMGQAPLTPGGGPDMAQFMQMQMQLMQNMLNMQQQQSGQFTPQQMSQQGNDYLSANRPMSMASQQSYGPPQNQGRSMTMMNPPAGWGNNPSPGNSRPTSVMPPMGSYAPSTNGLQVNGGYAPSIAPTERSNVGLPGRYRPVTQYGDSGRSQSMTSSLTLQAFTNQQPQAGPGTPYNATSAQTPKSTIRVVERPKGAPRMSTVRVPDEDEEELWADAKKKREEKKKSRFTFGRSKKEPAAQEPALSDLYQNMD